MNAQIKVTKLAVILALIVICLLIIGLVVVPLSRMWNDMERRADNLKLQYMRNSISVGNFDEALKKYRAYENLALQTGTDEEEIAVFLKEIEAFGRDLNIRIANIEPLPDEKRQFSHVLLIDVQIEGSIEDLLTLLHNIAASRTLICVEKMDVAVKDRRDTTIVSRLVFSKTFLL